MRPMRALFEVGLVPRPGEQELHPLAQRALEPFDLRRPAEHPARLFVLGEPGVERLGDRGKVRRDRRLERA